MDSRLEILVKEMEKIHPHYTVAEVGKILDLGRRLLSEEQAQKPTAPASLIEEIERFSFPLLDGTPYGIELRKILSRYARPISGQEGKDTSSDKGLREALKEEGEVTMNENLKCLKCHWLCFTLSGYSDWTVTGEWIDCPSGRFKQLDKYEDTKNEGLLALAAKECPYFKEGMPAEETSLDEPTGVVDDRYEEFKKLQPRPAAGTEKEPRHE